RLLLWFDGTEGGAPGDLGQGAQAFAFQLRTVTSRLSALQQRQEVVLGCLESPAFLARFLKLDAERARTTQTAIERLRSVVKGAVVQLMLAAHPLPRAVVAPGEAPLEGPARALATAWNAAAELSPGDAVQSALQEVLALVGLVPEDVVDTESGLRELDLSDVAPPLRLIYALDVPRRRVLMILGEGLDRAYYGDSVRFAEQRWRQYCRELGAAVPARDVAR
ncbi:MAG TPA: hypothetical protein VJU61_02490, partial [Polyangiaceae bacterium]|nr:hypothetical protein [Polyangiaceae bacterium]